MVYLLVGIGRSGTSLLQSILFHQNGITVYPETQLFRRFLVANNTSRDSVIKNQFINILRQNNPRFKNLSHYFDIENLENKKYSINEVVELFRKKDESILLKDARNLDYLSMISAHVTDLKAICTVRDLRDVILSRMKADFSKKWGLLLNLVIMRFQYSSLLKYEKKEKVFLIRYEDFIDGNLSALDELGIINKGVEGIDLTEISNILFSEEELSKHKGKNKQTIDSSNFKKWKKELPGGIIFMVEFFFNDYLKRFGYETTYENKALTIGNNIINHLFSVIYFLYNWISIYRDKRFYRL